MVVTNPSLIPRKPTGNGGQYFFVSSRNKMYRLTQEVEIQRGRRQVKSPKAVSSPEVLG